MSKWFCEDGVHVLHDWSQWEIIEAEFSLGLLFGKRAGQRFVRDVRARRCENCKLTDWKDI